MTLPPDFKEHNGFIVLTGYDGNGMDVDCECGGWFRAYRDQPSGRPKGKAWCKCDGCGRDDWRPVERSA